MPLRLTISRFLVHCGFILAALSYVSAQPPEAPREPDAEDVIQQAIAALGGDKYLNVKTQIGRGKFSLIRGGMVVSFQTFTDVIVFPDKERTEFRSSGTKTVQANMGKTGWVLDGATESLRDQTSGQIQDFERGLRTSLDNLLRGYWKGNAKLEFVGRRPATLGKRNNVVKLIYDNGLAVEFEFGADDGLPVKALHKRLGPDNTELIEEDRYAQFIEVAGVRSPFIIDRFQSGVHVTRINYESIEFNRSISDSIFSKPENAKQARRDIKL